MDWIPNNDPNILPEYDQYLIYIVNGDNFIAYPEQDGWFSFGEWIKHSDVTHYCLITKPLNMS